MIGGRKVRKVEENNQLEKISGLVEGIVYQNEENGYTVCELDVDGELVMANGILPFLAEGETINALGEWENHPKYGKQFRIESFEKELPATSSAILKYLSSGTVKGIGPLTAAKIVERFGDETFEVIEKTPEMLCDIPGLSRRKALEISQSFKEQFGLRSVVMFCRDYLPPASAVKIYKKWGGSSVDVIKNNPYRLCSEIGGIGFEKADRIASSLGMLSNSPERIMAGLEYILLSTSFTNGHTCIPRDRIGEVAQGLLGIEPDEVTAPLEKAIEQKRLVSHVFDGREYLYLKKYFDEETYVVRKLCLIDEMCGRLDFDEIHRFITSVEAEEGIQYAKKQREAIISALSGGVMILTGGPGTGKTTVIRALLRVFEMMDMDVALAAPTGRAAKRMSELTRHEAKTIHRLLEMSYENDDVAEFRRNENDLLDENVIIVDEASMIDISLIDALLKAIRPGSRLILIGDFNQLPSVGPGNVLSDLICSDVFNTVELHDIFRQAGESMIVTNAHRIINGEYPDIDAKTGDFFFLTRDTDEQIAKTIADLCVNRLPKTYGDEIRSEIQVITPSKKSRVGTELLNVSLQAAINPPSADKRERKERQTIFRVGDKVMQIKNNYDREWMVGEKKGVGVFNGDIGLIESIDPKNEYVSVLFDDRRVEYGFSELDELEHAFAITVHKSQGSEYPVVIMPMYSFAPMLLTRNLFYTAVTRSQRMVILVGRKDVVMNMVDNNRQAKRYTGLRRLLVAYVQGETNELSLPEE